MMSLFQTVTGAWHIPSILTVAGWVLSGALIFIGLWVNREDRIKAAVKEQASQLKITELEERTRIKPLRERLIALINTIDPGVLEQVRSLKDDMTGIANWKLPINTANSLKELCDEKGASEFARFETTGDVSIRTGEGVLGGQFTDVKLTITRKLITP